MTDHRNPESRMDLALNLISRRADPTAFRPPAPSTGGKGWLDVLGGLLHTTMFGGVRQPGLPYSGMVPSSAGFDAAHPGKGMNLLQTMEWAGRKGIREPITTALTFGQTMGNPERRSGESFRDWMGRTVANKDRWGAAYDVAQDRSMGQSAMLMSQGLLGVVGIGSGGDITNPDELADMQARQLYRKGSGMVDALGRFTIDPAAIVGGKILGAGTQAGARAVTEAARTGQGVMGRFFRGRGIENPRRWLGQVDSPDVVLPSPEGALPGFAWVNPTNPHNFSRYPRIRTDAYLDDIRSARAPVQPVTHQVPAPGSPASVLDLPPGMEMSMVRAPRPVQGGVFTGTAAEGKTLPEIGQMVGLHRSAYPPDVLPLTRTEMAKIWPSVSRMYADDIVDSVINARRSRDTIRLRAVFDHPRLGGAVAEEWAAVDDSLLHFAARSFTRPGVEVAESTRFGSDVSGLGAWFRIPHARLGFPDEINAARVEQVRRLVAADLKEITLKWVDEAGLPSRVSVARAQTPGQPIGPSAYTNPMAPRWWDEAGEQVAMPGVGGTTGREVFESSIDPRKDIDWFMNARRGDQFGEDEILVSAKTLAENIVQGGPVWVSGVGGARATMPGITKAQMEFGPGAQPFLRRLLEEMKKIEAEPDVRNLIQRLIREPAGHGREALREQVLRATDQARRNVLESQGWRNLPSVAATGERTAMAGRLGGEQLPATVALRRLAAGEYAPKDWLRIGMDANLDMLQGQSPIPPGWDKFSSFARELVESKISSRWATQREEELRTFLKSLNDDLTDLDLAGWLANQETRAPLGWRHENRLGSWWDEGVSEGLSTRLPRARPPVVDTWIQRLVGWEPRGAKEQAQMVLKADWKESLRAAYRNWVEDPIISARLNTYVEAEALERATQAGAGPGIPFTQFKPTPKPPPGLLG